MLTIANPPNRSKITSALRGPAHFQILPLPPAAAVGQGPSRQSSTNQTRRAASVQSPRIAAPPFAAPWRGGSPPSSRPPRPSSIRQGHLPFLPRRRRRPIPLLLTPALLTLHSSCVSDRPAGGGVPRQVPLRLRPRRAAPLRLPLRGRLPRRDAPAQATASRPASLPRPPPRREAPLPAFPRAPPLRVRDCGARGAGSSRWWAAGRGGGRGEAGGGSGGWRGRQGRSL